MANENENQESGQNTEVLDQQVTTQQSTEGAEFQSSPEQQSGEQTQQTSQKTSAETQQQVQKQSEWTAEKIAEIAAQTAARVNGANVRQQQQQKQLSQEEVDKLLNPVRVTAETMAEMGIENATPKQIAAYQKLMNAAVKNATSVMSMQLEQRMRSIQEYAAPMERFYQEQAAARYKQDFFAEHKELAKYEKFVAAAAAQVSPTNADGSPKEVKAVMKEVADYVKDMLKTAGVNLSGEQQQQTTHSAGGGGEVPRMASLQQSGRSQAGAPRGGSNNPDASIYD